MRLLQHQGGAVTGQVHEALFGALIADGEAKEAVERQTGVQIGADELRDHTRHETSTLATGPPSCDFLQPSPA